MSTSVLLIIFVSAFFHAGWNLLVKHDGGGGAFVLRMLIALCVLGALPALLAEIFIGPLLVHVWPHLLISGGVFCAIYLIGLNCAYGATDFTVVYPVARALPVLVIALVELPMGRIPTPWGWAGLVAVVAGCLLAPMTSWRELRPATYLNRSMSWILLAAAGTIGYSLIDDLGAERMVERDLGGVVSAMRYCYFYLSMSTVGFLIFQVSTRKSRPDTKATGWLRPTIGGLMCLAGYGPIIWVYQLTANASYVVAARQLSVVIGVGIAIVIFREPGRMIRFSAALLIAGGIVTLRIGG